MKKENKKKSKKEDKIKKAHTGYKSLLKSERVKKEEKLK